MSFIAGSYTATLTAAGLGHTENGFDLEQVTYADPIRVDAQGDAKMDGVYRGRDMAMATVLSEYNLAAVLAAYWPHAALGVIGLVGRLQSAIAGQVVLTAVAGLPASTFPATLTIPLVLLQENVPHSLLYANRHRVVPWRSTVLPVVSGPNMVHFTST